MEINELHQIELCVLFEPFIAQESMYKEINKDINLDLMNNISL
jgi:hypothetical protein